MSNKVIAEKKLEAFIAACESKGYHHSVSDIENGRQLVISNLRDRVPVSIYFKKGSVVVGGKESALKEEIQKLKEEIESNPTATKEALKSAARACATTFDVMLSEFRNKIKEGLSSITSSLEIENNPNDKIEYIAKLSRGSSSITITQYRRGTLLLQGKEDKLFDDCCSTVERVANPSEKDVISRFISKDEEGLKKFAAKYTPEINLIAEKNVKKMLGDTYDYLEAYDRKYFIAAESLLLTEIPLPEYSPIVMPAAKAFEGLAKKIIIGIKLSPSGFSDFSILGNKNDPTRKVICGLATHCDTFLLALHVAIKQYRHFMMHSDDSPVTKVDTLKDAAEKLNDIYKESKRLTVPLFKPLLSRVPRFLFDASWQTPQGLNRSKSCGADRCCTRPSSSR